MTHTGYAGIDDNIQLRHEATGYRYSDKESNWEPTQRIYSNPVPAGSLSTTANDMSRFLQMFLNQGTLNNNRVLPEKMLDMMFTKQFSHHPSLSGYSLGFEVFKINGITVFSKGGMVPGFVSLILLIPEMDTGIFLSVNSSEDSVIEEIVMQYWQMLFGRLHATKTDSSNTGSQVPLDINHFTGSYRQNRLNRNTIEEVFGHIRNTINVWNSADTLKVYHDGQMQSYLAFEPLIFTNLADPVRKMVFHANTNGKITGMSRDNRIAGAYVPVKYEKIPWYDSNDFMNEWFGIFIIGMMLYLFYPIIWIIGKLTGKFRNQPVQKSVNIAQVVTFLFSILSLIWIKGYFVKLLQTGSDIIYGIPPELIEYNLIPIFMLLLLIVGMRYLFHLFRKREGHKITRFFLSVHYVSSIVFMLVLYRWHFIGFNF